MLLLGYLFFHHAKESVHVQLLLIISKNTTLFKIRHEQIITVILILLVVAGIFIISPPDNWISENVNPVYNETKLNEAFENNMFDEDLFKSDIKIICFFGIGCKYCQLTDKKLGIIQKRYPEIKMNFIGVLWGTTEKYEIFTHYSEIEFIKSYLINPVIFLDITYGKMPLVLIMKNGVITHKFNYINLHEDKFIESIIN